VTDGRPMMLSMLYPNDRFDKILGQCEMNTAKPDLTEEYTEMRDSRD